MDGVRQSRRRGGMSVMRFARWPDEGDAMATGHGGDPGWVEPAALLAGQLREFAEHGLDPGARRDEHQRPGGFGPLAAEAMHPAAGAVEEAARVQMDRHATAIVALDHDAAGEHIERLVLLAVAVRRDALARWDGDFDAHEAAAGLARLGLVDLVDARIGSARPAPVGLKMLGVWVVSSMVGLPDVRRTQLWTECLSNIDRLYVYMSSMPA